MAEKRKNNSAVKPSSKRLKVNDVLAILDMHRLKKEEQNPGVGFHPADPKKYGAACAYDLAFRLVSSFSKEKASMDARALWNSLGDALIVDSQFLIRYIELLGNRYISLAEDHADILGWLEFDSPVDVWKNSEMLVPAARALCAYMAYRGLPYIEYDDDGAPVIMAFTDFSKCGVFEDMNDGLSAGIAFTDAFVDISHDIFDASTLRERFTENVEELLSYGSWEERILPPEAFPPTEDFKSAEEFALHSLTSLAMKHRVFGDEVPTDLSPILPFIDRGAEAGWTSESAPKNLTEEQTMLFVSLFGLMFGDAVIEKHYKETEKNESEDDDSPLSLPSSDDATDDANHRLHIMREVFDNFARACDREIDFINTVLGGFSLRKWIEDNFQKAIKEGWQGDEYKTGRVKCLTGLRLAASRMPKDADLYSTMVDICEGWSIFERSLFQSYDTCVMAGYADERDEKANRFFPLTLAAEFGQNCKNDEVFSYSGNDFDGWPFLSGIFTDDVDNLLAVMSSQGILAPLAGDVKNRGFYGRLLGWASPITEISAFLLEDSGQIREYFRDLVYQGGIDSWAYFFVRNIE